jgi:hypothetical protein
MTSCSMIHTSRIMNIVTDVQVILRFCPRNLKGCNVGVTGGRDL